MYKQQQNTFLILSTSMQNPNEHQVHSLAHVVLCYYPDTWKQGVCII